ncbi:hypothetical protein [Vibrio scophthalmi]|uniref:Lipoprotein n=1 Tax=Vibrio scophthalmi LMG 19158 TaxID=870967 RepID=F9RSY9_9VIBR|nr:hypothetical protein [Vibrio scophthalmi]EGU31555.1 hypothetical protein VIS19158_20032 [Vibrio scophthalmi LMG 19158]
MKLHFKLLVKLLSSIFLLLSITACGPNPQDDIPLFKNYIEENINKKSDDPYISSSVKPGDAMYEYLTKLQQGAGDERLLEPLIKAGNTDAMVWMARTNSNDLEMRGEVLGLLARAMEAGDPFAALALSSGGEECWDFGNSSLSSQAAKSIGINVNTKIETCSKKNWAIAMEGFNELAQKGDLRSQYFLLSMERIQQPDDSVEAHEHYLKEVIRFAEGYYYQPLVDYVKTILVKEKGSYQLKSESKELESTAISLLTIAANHNYIPAIKKLIEYNYQNIEKTDQLFKHGVRLGSKGSITWQMIIFADFDDKRIYTPSEVYYFSRLYWKITGDNTMLRFDYEKGSLTDDEIQLLNIEVDKQYNKITPMVYIDNFTLRTNWIDRTN